MRRSILGCLALFSCIAVNAEVLPITNGLYMGMGYASSNRAVENAEYQSEITVNDLSVAAVLKDDNGRVAHLIYTLTPIGEEFFNLDVTLKYQTGSGPNGEWHGKGIGNCHVGICHFNSEIENITDDIKSIQISDLFALEHGSEIRRKVAVDIYTTANHTMSYALAEMVTLTTEGIE